MSIDRINKVLEQLHLFSEEVVEFKPPVVPEEVSAFEEKHGIVLPEDYKYLLSVTNGLSLMGDCILGIGNPTRSEDLESVCHIEHFECGNPMPLHLIPFLPDGFGNHYCFDVHHGNIVFWQHDVDYTKSSPDVVYSELSELLQEIFIDWTLESFNYDGSEKENLDNS